MNEWIPFPCDAARPPHTYWMDPSAGLQSQYPIHPRTTQSRADMSSPALELLDEYWFFSNTLANRNKPPCSSPNKGSSSCSAGPSRLYAASGGRRLLRTPSLPSPSKLDLVPVEEERRQDAAAGSGNRRQQQQEEDDLNWSSIYEGVLRTRMAEGANNNRGSRSALRRAPSMPVPSSSATGQPKPTPPTSARRRPSPRSMSASQQQPVLLPRSKSGVFRAEDKKWRSSGDLESIEVQGFRDLGFVFDKEDLRESLAGVLPGLKQQAAGKTARSRSSSGRSYLSEAWQRPPSLVRVQSEARSAAEVKDQLRMWAQAVACNVRQEC